MKLVLAVILAALCVFIFLGYAVTDMPESVLYWNRNIAGVMLLLLTALALEAPTTDNKVRDVIQCLSVTVLMVIAYLVTNSSYGPLVPTWFANLWTQAIIGLIGIVFAAWCALETKAPDEG